MSEITFSRMLDFWNQEDVLGLDEFASRQRLRLRHRRIPLPAWNEVLSIALHGAGADVSEIGSTWVGSLANMNVLREFEPAEIQSLGGAAAFHPFLWDTCHLPHTNVIVATPWYLDLRVIYYRRDLLHQAGVDEVTAFETPYHLQDTLARLRALGIERPLAMATDSGGARILHNVVSWIWAMGGDFRTPDGRQMTIQEAEARKGLLAYYSLHPYLIRKDDSPDGLTTEHDANALFYSGQAAVTLASASHYYHAYITGDPPLAPIVAENFGVASVLGAPFVGGCNLVIWRHCVHEEAALNLIRFLSSPAGAKKAFGALSALPANITALRTLPIEHTPPYAAILESLLKGRAINTFFRWAILEEYFIVLFSRMWQDVLANPDMDIAAELEKRLVDFATKAQQTLLK